MPYLTIITAAHKSYSGLLRFHETLAPLLSSQLHWIIKDSGACAKSASWLSSLQCPYIHSISAPDNGIYSALNTAIASCGTEFYLVAGLDDHLNPSALVDLLDMLVSGSLSNVDVASFPVIIEGREFHRKFWRPLAVSVGGLVSSHSVGTLIRCALHERIGKYDESYRILADSLFLKRAYQNGAHFRRFKGPIMGEFSTTGISHTQHQKRIIEAFNYNVETGSPVWLQALLLALRITLQRIVRLQ